jgi:hypothetical protein
MSLVAGEAEQMTPVVEELVDSAAMDEGGGSLLCADEVEREKHHKTAEECPGQKLAEGNDGKRDWLGDRAGNCLCHDETSWDRASQIKYEIDYEGRTGLRQVLRRLQWRDRAGVPPASSFHLQLLF